MEDQASSERPLYVVPLWLGITASTVLIVDTVVEMWDPGVTKLEWLVPLCMGSYFLFYVSQRVGEPLGMYWRKPRVILANLLLLIGACWAAREPFIKFCVR